jgi:hypothetical protein
MKIRYDGNIYTEKAIVRAADDYSQIAKVTVKFHDQYIECSFSHCQYDEKTTISEFSNYIIDCMNQEN